MAGTLPPRPWNREREFVALRNAIIDPVSGINKYIAAANATANIYDIGDYGQVILLKNIILPDAGTGEHGAVFTLQPGQYAVNYDPFITLTLENGGDNETADGPGIAIELKTTVFIDFTDPGDGTVDILLFRYLQALESLIESLRWIQAFPRRLKEIAPVNYRLEEDNPDHIVVGLEIQTVFATI
jgi:hypothetical protein